MLELIDQNYLWILFWLFINLNNR